MMTQTKAKIGAKTAKAMVEHPTLRKAAATVAPPAAKAGFRLGRRRTRRRALAQAERLQDIARTAGETLATYGPPAAEALGLTEPPRKARTAPAVAIGAVLGAGAVYFLEPNLGAARRARVQRLIASGNQRRG
jgi:hypothetical protein